MAALTIEFPQTVWTVEFGGDEIVVAEVTMTGGTGGSGLELGETSSTAYRGDRGKTAFDHSQVVTGNPHGTTAADVGADPSGTAATAVTVHTADTTAVHGIADTSALVVTSDARLSDARTPTAHTHPAADIASGTVGTARLGTGAANAATFLRGDGSWAAPAAGDSGYSRSFLLGGM